TTSAAGCPWRSAQESWGRYSIKCGIAGHHGVRSSSAPAAEKYQPIPGTSRGEEGHPCPISWLLPRRRCSCASLLRSIGVARNDGECTQVHASEEMTSRPYRCPAEEAQRSCVNSVHPQPSPSIRSADRLELIEIGGSPYPCRR